MALLRASGLQRQGLLLAASPSRWQMKELAVWDGDAADLEVELREGPSDKSGKMLGE